jgi:drug/metabolite transporter (DMT)-like permease
MESVFAALGGMLLLSEKASSGILLGFALMLAGMLTTQLDVTVKPRAGH